MASRPLRQGAAGRPRPRGVGAIVHARCYWAVGKRSQSSCGRFDHHLLLRGALEVGASLLARRLTPILPAMTMADALEPTRIHCIPSLTGSRTAVVATGPCRAPITSSWTWD
jgi:predicted ATPase with chaperone activity